MIVLTLAGEPQPAGESCPPAHEQSAERVRTLLSSPLLLQMRERYNLGTASAPDVRLLTNERDRDTCRALWEALRSTTTELGPEDRVTFYRSGDTFFVPILRSRRPGPPGGVGLDGYSSLDVYDSSLRLVGRFGA
ncbi:hypothetical protein [Longimicrobium sp.]|uniref:hypothetical protein n=1 Tax=Longimicrobium sp. TaxID=2029185 RepID=UPI002E2F2EF6|nr:hypothetical protein [Longimicrobium sp.]HEX6041307.1 hypothetical protein [Longimicrobium sp.]